jgi:hypothetical protein
MRRDTCLALLIVPLLGICAARAAPVPYVGPYAGGAELMARLDPKRPYVRQDNSWNDSNMGWKGMVGVRFTRHFAFEAGFTDFGRASALATPNEPLRTRTRAFTAFGVATMPVGKVDVFAKAGPARMQSTGHVGGTFFDHQQRKIAYGTGVQLVKRRLTVRAEYEKFGKAAAGDLDSVSLGFRLAFRQR